jgi:hypothetical protein
MKSAEMICPGLMRPVSKPHAGASRCDFSDLPAASSAAASAVGAQSRTLG